MEKNGYTTIKIRSDVVTEFIDPLVGTHGFDSRTDVIKEAVKDLIKKYQVTTTIQ